MVQVSLCLVSSLVLGQSEDWGSGVEFVYLVRTVYCVLLSFPGFVIHIKRICTGIEFEKNRIETFLFGFQVPLKVVPDFNS